MSLREEAPLPVLLCILTAVTGVVDAVSFLALGHVFVANMTGNVVFLGFAAAGAADLSVPASLAAIVAFMAGALMGGLVTAGSTDRMRLLGVGVVVKIALTAAALGVSLAGAIDGPARYALIVLLAVAMGLQSAIVRRAAGSEPSTNVLTTTLTALAADAPIGGGAGPSSHRVLAALTMLAGAAAGAALVLGNGVHWALALAIALLAASAATILRMSTSAAR
jgi:uncharacterized membrane protein YoaK (UPF0700 family)